MPVGGSQIAEARPQAADAPLLHALARFASGLSLDGIPERVRHEAKLCVLDTVGCMLAGADTPEGTAFLAAERRASGAGASLAQPRLSPLAEARVLGFFGDVFELNDLIGGHASIGNVSAAVAVARAENASGAELLRAVIAGIEITSRINEAQSWQKKAFDELGMVVVSLVSAIGAAAAVALLRGLPEPQLAAALEIAGAIACWGPAEVIFGDGGTIKPIQFGACPADSAIRAAGYAEAGLTGPARLLESDMGLLRTLTRGYDPQVIRGDGTWHLLRPQRKLHASCGLTHSSIDALVKLRREGVDFGAATRIELGVPVTIIPAVSKSWPPTTPNEARFHLQYCAALAASGVDVITPEHSLHFERYLARPGIGALMGKIGLTVIEVAPGTPGYRYHRSRVRVSGANGVVAEGRCDGPRGSYSDPLSDAQLVEKFRGLASARLDGPTIDSFVERVMTLERQPECGWLFEVLDRAQQRSPRETAAGKEGA